MIEPLEKFLSHYPGGRPAFCKKVRVTQGRLSQVLGGDSASPRLALAIHRETDGAVPASLLRPDLWRSPRDVPQDARRAGVAA